MSDRLCEQCNAVRGPVIPLVQHEPSCPVLAASKLEQTTQETIKGLCPICRGVTYDNTDIGGSIEVDHQSWCPHGIPPMSDWVTFETATPTSDLTSLTEPHPQRDRVMFTELVANVSKMVWTLADVYKYRVTPTVVQGAHSDDLKRRFFVESVIERLRQT